MVAVFKKTPVPIMVPITIEIESVRVKPRRSLLILSFLVLIPIENPRGEEIVNQFGTNKKACSMAGLIGKFK
jgi:hypothetical protein